jgi:hypothetical protein
MDRPRTGGSGSAPARFLESAGQCETAGVVAPDERQHHQIGYSLTGARNSPASPEATGLEADKLSGLHVKSYFDNYLGQYKDTVGPLMGKRGLQYIITDSWEAGVQNWSDDMIAEFTKHRGYNMRPWLPVLAGRVVESAEASNRFLFDCRKTIADLTTENHYDQLAKFCAGIKIICGVCERVVPTGIHGMRLAFSPDPLRLWHANFSSPNVILLYNTG